MQDNRLFEVALSAICGGVIPGSALQARSRGSIAAASRHTLSKETNALCNATAHS